VIFSHFGCAKLIWKIAGPDCTMVLLDAKGRRPSDVIMDATHTVVRHLIELLGSPRPTHSATLSLGVLWLARLGTEPGGGGAAFLATKPLCPAPTRSRN